MDNILTGTCGYDYLDWRGTFYPAELDRRDWLAFYARQFRALELDFTYYRMPEASTLESMAERAGPGLVFTVKAHESLTHLFRDHDTALQGRTFREALSPLRTSGRLGAILFQFPYSFHYEPDNRRYLDRLLKDFDSWPLAVEFRNGEWVNSRVLEALRDRGAAFGATDLPDLPGLPPSLGTVTAELSYIRFHGRNRQTWWGSDAAARYDYLYRPEELDPWAGRIRAMARESRRVFVFFNNHRNGQAPANARTLEGLLGAGPGQDRPS